LCSLLYSLNARSSHFWPLLKKYAFQQNLIELCIECGAAWSAEDGGSRTWGAAEQEINRLRRVFEGQRQQESKAELTHKRPRRTRDYRGRIATIIRHVPHGN
jgi:hypothetical protein